MAHEGLGRGGANVAPPSCPELLLLSDSGCCHQVSVLVVFFCLKLLGPSGTLLSFPPLPLHLFHGGRRRIFARITTVVTGKTTSAPTAVNHKLTIKG